MTSKPELSRGSGSGGGWHDRDAGPGGSSRLDEPLAPSGGRRLFHRLRAHAALTRLWGLYLLASTLMLVVNKVAVHFLPSPTVVLFFQLVACVLAAGCGGACCGGAGARGAPLPGVGGPDGAGAWAWKPHAGLAGLFLACTWCGLKTLEGSTWETLLVLRCCLPLLVGHLEAAWLGRRPPSKRAWAAIGGMTLATAAFAGQGYAGFKLQLGPPGWVLLWLVLNTADVLANKYVLETQPLGAAPRAGLVSLLALAPVTLLAWLRGDHVVILRDFEWNPAAGITLTLSCLCAALVTIAAYALRGAVSASGYVVLTNACRLITAFLSLLMWGGLSSWPAMLCLLAALASAGMYRQAPPRAGGGGIVLPVSSAAGDAREH